MLNIRSTTTHKAKISSGPHSSCEKAGSLKKPSVDRFSSSKLNLQRTQRTVQEKHQNHHIDGLNKHYHYSKKFVSTSKSFVVEQKEASYTPPPLPIVETIAKLAKANGFQSLSKTALVATQHLLPTTDSLFKIFIDILGLAPHNIFLAGKHYSTCKPVYDQLKSLGIHMLPVPTPKKPTEYERVVMQKHVDNWEEIIVPNLKKNGIEQVIILDEGGITIKAAPTKIFTEFNTAAIEQTQYGLYGVENTCPVALVTVANSAAKKLLEGHLIGEQIARALNEIKNSLVDTATDKPVCGVIGNGAIGSAAAKFLIDAGYTVLVYDANPTAFKNLKGNFYRIRSLETIFHRSNIVFGCTGYDVTKHVDLMKLVKPIALISCSSQSKEFFSGLQQLMRTGYKLVSNKSGHPIPDIVSASNTGTQIRIIQSGYPINFRLHVEGYPARKMALTRGLLLIGFIQAVLNAKKMIKDGYTPNGFEPIPLDAKMQALLVNLWKEDQPHGCLDGTFLELLSKFEDVAWIEENSAWNPPNSHPEPGPEVPNSNSNDLSALSNTNFSAGKTPKTLNLLSFFSQATKQNTNKHITTNPEVLPAPLETSVLEKRIC